MYVIDKNKKIKYLWTNSETNVQKPLCENYETWPKEIQKTQWNGVIIPYLCIGRLTRVKMSVLLKFIYKFNTIPTTIPEAFCRNWQAHLKLIWKCKDLEVPRNSDKEQSWSPITMISRLTIKLQKSRQVTLA